MPEKRQQPKTEVAAPGPDAIGGGAEAASPDEHGALSSSAPVHGPVHEARDAEYEPFVRSDVDYGDWQPPALLPRFEPRVGFVQRWVKVSDVAFGDDVRNTTRRFANEGWQPRDPQTVQGGKSAAPTLDHAQFGCCISVGGLVLCEMPLKRNAQRTDFYHNRLAEQTRSIDRQLMKVQQPGHPIDRQARSRVTVGKRPRVQDDV